MKPVQVGYEMLWPMFSVMDDLKLIDINFPVILVPVCNKNNVDKCLLYNEVHHNRLKSFWFRNSLLWLCIEPKAELDNHSFLSPSSIGLGSRKPCNKVSRIWLELEAFYQRHRPLLGQRGDWICIAISTPFLLGSSWSSTLMPRCPARKQLCLVSNEQKVRLHQKVMEDQSGHSLLRIFL